MSKLAKNVTWDAPNKQKLTELYDAGYDDYKLSEHFGSTFYAVGKQRSVMGLTKFKKTGTKRAPKQLVVEKPTIKNVITYLKDGQRHYCMLPNNEKTLEEETIRNLVYKQRVTELFVLKPVTKFVTNTITEITL